MSAVAKEKANSSEKWERVLLGDISSDISYGYTASSTEEPVGPRMLRITDIQDNAVNWETVPYCKIDEKEIDKYLLSKNDIVFARTGATVGKSFLIPSNVTKSVYASYLIRVRLQEGIDPKYISYFFQSGDYWSQIRQNQVGIGQPNVNGSKLKKLEAPLAPPEQQKRIVAKIEEIFSHIDAGIEALKKAKQILKQYRQSVLKAAVTGELTKEWREKNNFSQESWQESTIGEIAKVQTGKTPKRSSDEFWKNGTIPWLTSSATNELFTHHADQFVTQAALDSGLKLFEPGTLLLAMYGEGKTRGQVTEITFQATCNQACAAIIVDEDKANRGFVRLRLNENYEQTRKAASGGNQPNLNLSKVREISVPLPPLSEQAEIVSQVEQKLEAINRLENEIEKQVVKAEKNKQSVLAAAFSGRL